MRLGLLILSIFVVGALSNVGALTIPLEHASSDASPWRDVVDLPQALAEARMGHVTIAGYDFTLERNPIAEGAVWGLDAKPMGVVTVDDTVTFEGTANGFPARLAVTQAGIFALILAPDPVQLDPAWLTVPGAPLGAVTVTPWSALPPTGGVIDQQPAQKDSEALPASRESDASGGTGTLTAQFLIESDFHSYNVWSLAGACNECWIQIQQAVMNVAQELFHQTPIQFQITSQWACTSVAACPYEDLDMGVWLNQFKDRWEDEVGIPDFDAGHLMIGRNLPTAFGASSRILPDLRGYAVSKVLSYTPPAAILLQGPPRYATVAHEIGHNFDAVHEEAESIPASVDYPDGLGAYTLMSDAGTEPRINFTDGSNDPARNNLDRIVVRAEWVL